MTYCLYPFESPFFLVSPETPECKLRGPQQIALPYRRLSGCSCSPKGAMLRSQPCLPWILLLLSPFFFEAPGLFLVAASSQLNSTCKVWAQFSVTDVGAQFVEDAQLVIGKRGSHRSHLVAEQPLMPRRCKAAI